MGSPRVTKLLESIKNPCKKTIKYHKKVIKHESQEASGATWSTYVAPGGSKTISEEKSTSHLVQNGGQFGVILGAFWLIIAVQGRPKVEN